MIMQLDIGAIQTDIQPRGTTHKELIDEYAEAMRDGAQFPPITVVGNGCDYWLVDGHHRLNAMKANGAKVVSADVVNGDYEEACSNALEANHHFGMKRTNEEKRHYAIMAYDWFIRKGVNPTSGAIAKKVGVSESFARKLFNEGVLKRIEDAPQTGANGSVYNARTTHGAKYTPSTPPKICSYSLSEPPRVNRPPLPDAPPPAAPGGSVQVPQPGGEFNPGALEGEIDGNSLCGEYDRFGLDLVDRGPEMRQAAAELDGVKEMIRAARRQLSALAAEGRPYIVKVTMQQTLIDLDNAARAVEAAKPYCVCRHCQGFAETRQYCNNCMTLGWQTKREYQCNAPEFKHESDR